MFIRKFLLCSWNVDVDGKRLTESEVGESSPACDRYVATPIRDFAYHPDSTISFCLELADGQGHRADHVYTIWNAGTSPRKDQTSANIFLCPGDADILLHGHGCTQPSTAWDLCLARRKEYSCLHGLEGRKNEPRIIYIPNCQSPTLTVKTSQTDPCSTLLAVDPNSNCKPCWPCVPITTRSIPCSLHAV